MRESNDRSYKVSLVYTVIWDGRDRDGRMLHSGIYIVNMEIGSFYRESKKIVLTR